MGREQYSDADGRLIARIEQRVDGLEDDRDDARKELADLKERVRDLENGQLRIVVIGSVLFGALGLLGPPIINIVLHTGGH